MRLTYAIKEAFLTLQGEGAYAGRRAVFMRFAGCNVWSGHEKDRTRDTAKGCCAAWCDTDFVGTNGLNGGMYSRQDLANLLHNLWGESSYGFVVCTGGEPSLQLDHFLIETIHEVGLRVHVETNGSRDLPGNVDWVTLSPKPPMNFVEQKYHEVKVIYPAIDPHPYERLSRNLFVQPQDAKDPETNKSNVDATIRFVMQNPKWRLSMQTHKIVGLP